MKSEPDLAGLVPERDGSQQVGVTTGIESIYSFIALPPTKLLLADIGSGGQGGIVESFLRMPVFCGIQVTDICQYKTAIDATGNRLNHSNRTGSYD